LIKGRLFNNYLPAAIWLGYHALVPNWRLSFLSALMLVRAGIVLYCFLIREEPTRRAPAYQIAIAWISTFLPTLMVWQPSAGLPGLVGEIIAVGGMVLFCFTCVDLGRSFGVSPAMRAPVSDGVYRWVSHPMYVSHVIVEAGILIASPTAWNLSIAAVAWGLYGMRALWEIRILAPQRTAGVAE
jgi:protein-S-isoprenylcysteine O-methyltransferase Ste14